MLEVVEAVAAGAEPGWVVVLNGAPRSGKSSIAAAMQATFDGTWINLGVDAFAGMTPAHLRPGIGLRPGGENPALERHIPVLYTGLFSAVRALSRLGLHVAVDVGVHDAYSTPFGVWRLVADCLRELPVLLVGVHCPVEVILARRAAASLRDEGRYATADEEGRAPEPVLRWQEAVHDPGIYDLSVDTATMSPAQCAARIGDRLEGPAPTALRRLA